jgi:hypothetical protein
MQHRYRVQRGDHLAFEEVGTIGARVTTRVLMRLHERPWFRGRDRDTVPTRIDRG